jgi:translation initiation factor IF-1
VSYLNEREQFFYKGLVLKPIKDIMFHVRLHQNSQIVVGFQSFNMRRHRIRVLLGDRVKIQISEFDSQRGKISYRFPQDRKKKDKFFD